MPLTLFPESLEEKRGVRLLRRKAGARARQASSINVRVGGAKVGDAKVGDAKVGDARALDARTLEEEVIVVRVVSEVAQF
jgi:hypothetical protein